MCRLRQARIICIQGLSLICLVPHLYLILTQVSHQGIWFNMALIIMLIVWLMALMAMIIYAALHKLPPDRKGIKICAILCDWQCIHYWLLMFQRRIFLVFCWFYDEQSRGGYYGQYTNQYRRWVEMSASLQMRWMEQYVALRILHRQVCGMLSEWCRTLLHRGTLSALASSPLLNNFKS